MGHRLVEAQNVQCRYPAKGCNYVGKSWTIHGILMYIWDILGHSMDIVDVLTIYCSEKGVLWGPRHWFVWPMLGNSFFAIDLNPMETHILFGDNPRVAMKLKIHSDVCQLNPFKSMVGLTTSLLKPWCHCWRKSHFLDLNIPPWTFGLSHLSL